MSVPLSFGRICFVVLVMRKGAESSWSGPWHLVCTLEVFHVHSYQDQFIQPVWAKCVYFACIFSLGLCFVCSFVLFDLFVLSPSFYVSLSSWVISLTVFGISVTNLYEPPRALATSTVSWVQSQGRCKTKATRVKGIIMSLALHYWIREAHHCSVPPPPVSEMTYTVSSGSLNSTIPYHTRCLWVTAFGTGRTQWQCWLQAVSGCYLSVLFIPRSPQSVCCELRFIQLGILSLLFSLNTVNLYVVEVCTF